MPKHVEEIDGIPHANATDKEIKELIEPLKIFKEDEFADLLHQCHNVIRNREKRDPVAAFDEIAKILFAKVFVERELKAKKKRQNLFSEEFLQDQIGDNPLEDLFQKTKDHYKAGRISESDEKLNLKPATGLEIVRLLEKYNLSDTSEDIKGIAFERFLGKTFRGEIGQFFTPRPIVEFTVRMMDRREGDVICDPASGSGGSSSVSSRSCASGYWPTQTGSTRTAKPRLRATGASPPKGRPSCFARSSKRFSPPSTMTARGHASGPSPTAAFTVLTLTTGWPAPAR
jgi:type I restriction enzyme M protein